MGSLSLFHCKKMSWGPTENYLLKPLSKYAKPFNPITFKEGRIHCSSSRIQPSTAVCHYDSRKLRYHPPLHSRDSIQKTQNKSSSEARRYNQSLKRASFIENLKERRNLDPLEMLTEDGDWSREQFWDVSKFLRQSARTTEILLLLICVILLLIHLEEKTSQNF